VLGSGEEDGAGFGVDMGEIDAQFFEEGGFVFIIFLIGG